MKRLELIELIGDCLTDIDLLRASLLPNDPNLASLDELRGRLDSRQRRLSAQIWNDNTPLFQNAAQALSDVNNDLGKTIADLKKLVETLGTLQRFFAAVDKILGIVLI